MVSGDREELLRRRIPLARNKVGNVVWRIGEDAVCKNCRTTWYLEQRGEKFKSSVREMKT
jgi:hypothetical protein